MVRQAIVGNHALMGRVVLATGITVLKTFAIVANRVLVLIPAILGRQTLVGDHALVGRHALAIPLAVLGSPALLEMW